jgi:MATE family multidrug resistance protein
MATPRAPFTQELTRLLQLAAPLLVGQLAVLGLGITDIVLSGRAGTDDLAGVMLGATLFDLPMMFIMGVFIANSTLAGRLHGRGDRAALNAHFFNTLWLALPIGLVAALAVTLMRLVVLPQLDTPASVKLIASGYLLPMTATAFLLPTLMAVRTTLEATGHPRLAMMFNLAAFAVNIPLDYAFINGWGWLPAMGGVGCGWATLVVVSGVIGTQLFYIHKTPHLHFLHLHRRLRRPEWPAVRELLALGTPMGGAILAEAGFFHVIPLMVASLGTLALAAHAVAMSFDMIMFMIPLALAQAITIRSANALGKDDTRGARHIAVTGLKVGLALALCQSLGVFLLRDQVPGMYTPDSTVASVAASLLLVAAGIRIFDGLHIVGTGILRGYGDTRSTLVISCVAFWLAGAPLAWLAASGRLDLTGSGIQNIWLAILGAVIFASAMTLWRVRTLMASPRDPLANKAPN